MFNYCQNLINRIESDYKRLQLMLFLKIILLHEYIEEIFKNNPNNLKDLKDLNH